MTERAGERKRERAVFDSSSMWQRSPSDGKMAGETSESSGTSLLHDAAATASKPRHFLKDVIFHGKFQVSRMTKIYSMYGFT